MNCRDTELLLLAERDGVLSSEQLAALSAHVATCPACRQLHAAIAETALFLKTDAANVAVPDAGGEWRQLQAQLRGEKIRTDKKRPLAPVIWFGAPLAVAAAIAFVFLTGQPTPQPAPATPAVETADGQTMAYVDQESGWLVVWAADASPKSSG